MQVKPNTAAVLLGMGDGDLMQLWEPGKKSGGAIVSLVERKAGGDLETYGGCWEHPQGL